MKPGKRKHEAGRGKKTKRHIQRNWEKRERDRRKRNEGECRSGEIKAAGESLLETQDKNKTEREQECWQERCYRSDGSHPKACLPSVFRAASP